MGGQSYSLGRVAGIRIGINWSVLLILALVMWTLATAIFPSTNPGLGDDVHFAMAVVAALAFFASILLHELGHALQARRDGMEIEGITLWLFGGVARFRGMFPSAGAEFRIAAAGPLVSLALGGAMVGIALAPGLPEPVDGVCAWLGYTNLLLCAFNLLPALPLDGGRLLRAALWRWRGDLGWATRIAAGAGRLLAVGLIALGIVMLVVEGVYSGIWLAAIGVFLYQAAQFEGQLAQRVPRVRDVMEREPIALAPDRPLDEAFERIVWRHPRPAYPVVDEGRPVGLLPYLDPYEAPRRGWSDLRVADLMLPLARVPALDADADLTHAVAALNASELGVALVLEGDRLAGMLSLADVARALGLPDRPPPGVARRPSAGPRG